MDRYDIVVQSIDPGADPERAARALVEALALAPDEAASALAALPRTVAYDRDEATADRALHALREHGLSVQLARSTPWSMPADPPPPRASLPELDEDQPRYVLPKVAIAPVEARPRDDARPSPAASPSLRGREDALSQPVELVPGERDSLPLRELDARASPKPATPPRARAAPSDPGFATAASAALGALWSGPAGAWLLHAVGIATLGALVHVVARAVGAFFGTSALVLGGLPDLAVVAIALGFAVAGFRAAFRAGLGGRLEAPDRLDADALLAYSGAGATLFFFAVIVAAIAAGGWLLSNPWARTLPLEQVLLGGLARHVATVLVIVSLHAPIGIALAVLRGRALAYVDPVGAWRLARGAPLELACACGAWAIAVLLAGGWIAGWLGSAAIAGWRIALALVPASIVLLLGWSAAGALMGALVRSEPAVRG